MTIEIKQLVIRAVVDPRRSAPASAPNSLGAPATAVLAAPLPRADRSALVAACVREVMRQLRKAGER